MYYTDEFVESLDNLPSVRLEDKQMLPDSPGIYLAIGKDKTVLYVGQSTRIRIRWKQHHRFRELHEIGNVHIAWITVSDPAFLIDIEKALIHHFKPPLNNAPIPKVKGMNKLAFHASIKEFDILADYCEKTNRNKKDVLRELLRSLEPKVKKLKSS